MLFKRTKSLSQLTFICPLFITTVYLSLKEMCNYIDEYK